jgi:hypothetical protein
MKLDGFVGSLLFDRVNFTPSSQSICFYNSETYLAGGFNTYDFNASYDIGAWVSTIVTRNYNITTKTTGGNPLEPVELSLVDQTDRVVWNGTTESLGKTDFSLTFTATNYTDTLRLEAFKEGFYNVTERVSFLSNTPIYISLTQKPLGDVNGDRVVNILDISLVAFSFDCKSGDARWNSKADLNKDGVINIIDITLVAKDYGKTI